MTHLETLDRHLGARYSPHTRRSFLGFAKRFVDTCGDKPSYSRDEVLGYVDSLIHAKYKAGTINVHLSAIRAMFDACSLTWPLTKRDTRLGLPQVDPEAPTLSPDEVSALIRGARSYPRTTLPIVTALATVWGLRGDEIVRTLARGCDGHTLEIQTAKGGRVRKHAIPRVLGPVLAFSPIDTSTRSLHDVFDRLMRTHVRPPRPREGWHSARRAVVTGLFEAGIEQHKVHTWLGWKMKEDISLRYYHPDPIKLDLEIYVRHPFLRVWLQ